MEDLNKHKKAKADEEKEHVDKKAEEEKEHQKKLTENRQKDELTEKHKLKYCKQRRISIVKGWL